MPETGRVLQFPTRCGRPTRSPEEARSISRAYLEMPAADRTEDFVTGCLGEPETLLSLCIALKELRNTVPSTVVDEGSRIYKWITSQTRRFGVFDECDYFLGEVAFLVGSACRLVGRRDEAELWLERAESGFRHTVNPAPLLANIAYERLALHYDMRRYDRIFELLPSLRTSFKKLNMGREVLKCQFLEATTLKDADRKLEALTRFAELRSDPLLRSEPTLLGLVLANLGELLSSGGRYGEAMAVFQEALSCESEPSQPLSAAHLKVAIAECLRNQGQLNAAVSSYRAAVSDYASVGMQTMVAYVRVLTAETLIASSRHREAEWEILAALPTIEEQKMVPEGFAAVALLRESVRSRKADPKALRDLRDHLKVKA
jgi:tetratricopeptide (TPR) repeat protein